MTSLTWLAFGAFTTSLFLQVIVIFLSHKHHLFIDHHATEKPQKFHQTSTPRSGGIGIFMGILFLLATPFGWKLVFSVLLAFLSGIFEDMHREINPKIRLLLQLISATAAVLLTHSVITYLGLGIYLPYFLGVLFSIFSIVGLMNAVNIIDGFNGLASGIVFLILIAFAIVSHQVGNHEIWKLTLITLSALVGFMLFNIPKGKIFLGDGGAYLLGFITALAGIFLASNYEKVSPWFILAVLIYPVWEVLFSIYRKVKEGKSPLEPDNRHMHMLIYRHITHNNPRTSLFIVLVCMPFILIPTLYAHNSGANFMTASLFILCYHWFYKYLLKQERSAS